MRSLIVTMSVLLVLAASGFGQPPAAAGRQGPKSPVQPAASMRRPKTGRVEVPRPSERARRYDRSGTVLWLVDWVWSGLVLGLFLVTGLSARIRDGARRLGRKWFWTIGIYFILFSVLIYLIDFPLDCYRGFVRQHAYGLSNQPFAKWLGDSLKALMVSTAAGFLFLWVPYLLVRKSPDRWWLYTGILAVPLLFLVMLVTPIWIAPLFNHFGPMKDQALEGKIRALARRAGIEGGRIYEVDKSRDTKAVNAYVIGVLTTKRIVLWDTLLAKLDEPEILFVMGHEMGHYVLGHIVQGVFFFSGLILVTLYAVHRGSAALIRRYRDRWGFDRLSDVASLPLVLLLATLFSLVVTPIGLAFSRHIEHEADRFGLEITQDNHAAATAFVKLLAENLGNPRPGLLSKLWRSSHPPIGERIDFCNTYRPWETGQPLKYGHRFRKPDGS